MFGAIVAGRLVMQEPNPDVIDQLTKAKQIYSRYETHFVFPLEQPYEINHLTVFLLGTPFPEGYGATVHFAWPGGEYFPLGTLTNARPSAIYKVRPHLPSARNPGPAQLGIEITSQAGVEALAAQLASKSAANSSSLAVVPKSDARGIAEKIVKNLFNYLHSFGEVKLTPETPIPLSVFQRWYDNFTRKIQHDPGASFLDRAD